MDRISIECLSVFGLPPVDFVNLAADLGCQKISLGPRPVVALPDSYPEWSLIDDIALRRETKAAMRDRGVAMVQSEGFFIFPGMDVVDTAPTLDFSKDMGAERVNTVLFDAELGRCIDQFGQFAELAAERDLGVTLEFIPGMAIGDLQTAAKVLREAGALNASLVIDSMHFFRSGGVVEELLALEPGMIGHAQICDVPLVSTFESYADEAQFERRDPGDGDLPLLDFLKAIPRDCLIGLEIPKRSLAQSGVQPFARLQPAVAATRALLAEI